MSRRPIEPDVVAHRGDARRYPENTIAAIEAAIEAGARYVEFDVQILGDDDTVVVLHDTDLRRTGGVDLDLESMHLVEQTRWPAGEPSRFGDTFSDVRVPTLAQMVACLGAYPDVTAFVELKTERLEAVTRRGAVEAVLRHLRPAFEQSVMISFDLDAMALASSNGARIGVVLDAYDDATLHEVTRLAPEWIFCDRDRLPPAPEPPWPGNWKWVVYEVTDPDEARDLASRGIAFVETMAVREMLADLGSVGR